jgi:alpha-tubulin suppressor-like RCC1 family protein
VTVTERLGGPPLTDVVEIASTYDASCARTASGVVYCWGRNSEGQLGVFSTEDQLSPVVVYAPSTQLPNP